MINSPCEANFQTRAATNCDGITVNSRQCAIRRTPRSVLIVLQKGSFVRCVRKLRGAVRMENGASPGWRI